MMEDHKRTGAYYQAVMANKRQFQGKVVLDVGTGSGILAIFAAKAGASKVYAVEATPMAVHARKLVEHNKVGKGPTVCVPQMPKGSIYLIYTHPYHHPQLFAVPNFQRLFSTHPDLSSPFMPSPALPPPAAVPCD